MSNIFDLKTIVMTPLIKLIIKHPKLMKSKIFLKAMVVFPEKVSKSYDSKVLNSNIDYKAALSYGLELMKNKPKQVLDLCTGTGFAAFMVLEYFPEACITGVDQSTTMIDIANGKIDALNMDRIHFKVGNAAKLDYEDERFDLIVISNGPVYLAEAARVLRHDGDILATFSFGGAAFLKAEEDIRSLLNDNGLRLMELKHVGEGVVIHGQKI